MAKYPIFLDLADRRVLLVGGGAVAVRKAHVLLDAGARLVVVAEQAGEVLTALCAKSHAELIRSRGHYYDLYTRQFREQREATIDRLGQFEKAVQF